MKFWLKLDWLVFTRRQTVVVLSVESTRRTGSANCSQSSFRSCISVIYSVASSFQAYLSEGSVLTPPAAGKPPTFCRTVFVAIISSVRRGVWCPCLISSYMGKIEESFPISSFKATVGLFLQQVLSCLFLWRGPIMILFIWFFFSFWTCRFASLACRLTPVFQIKEQMNVAAMTTRDGVIAQMNN